jgi:hypothetical protein
MPHWGARALRHSPRHVLEDALSLARWRAELVEVDRALSTRSPWHCQTQRSSTGTRDGSDSLPPAASPGPARRHPEPPPRPAAPADGAAAVSPPAPGNGGSNSATAEASADPEPEQRTQLLQPAYQPPTTMELKPDDWGFSGLRLRWGGGSRERRNQCRVRAAAADGEDVNAGAGKEGGESTDAAAAAAAVAAAAENSVFKVLPSQENEQRRAAAVATAAQELHMMQTLMKEKSRSKGTWERIVAGGAVLRSDLGGGGGGGEGGAATTSESARDVDLAETQNLSGAVAAMHPPPSPPAARRRRARTRTAGWAFPGGVGNGDDDSSARRGSQTARDGTIHSGGVAGAAAGAAHLVRSYTGWVSARRSSSTRKARAQRQQQQPPSSAATATASQRPTNSTRTLRHADFDRCIAERVRHQQCTFTIVRICRVHQRASPPCVCVSGLVYPALSLSVCVCVCNPAQPNLANSGHVMRVVTRPCLISPRACRAA